jgi:Flp pilus assembly secretin CpaC
MTVNRSERGLVQWLSRCLCAAVTAVAVLPSPALLAEAQEPQAPAAAQPAIPLKVTIVLSRYEGEKRKSSLPFTLHLIAGERSTSLRMGGTVPVPQGTLSVSPKEGQTTSIAQSFQYQQLGSNIDCTATVLADGRIRLGLTVMDSSLSTSAAPVANMPPTIQQFTSTNILVLRDGETLQYTTAADKFSGEVVRVDVTANILK